MRIYSTRRGGNPLEKALLLTALVFAAGPALSSNFSYTYITAEFSIVDFDEHVFLIDPQTGGAVEFDGLTGVGFGGSVQVTDAVYVGLASAYAETSGGSLELGESASQLFAGIVAPIGNRADLNIEVAYVTAEAEICAKLSGGFSECLRFEDDGVGIAAGARIWVQDNVELFGGYSRISWDEGDSTDGYTAGVAAWIGDHHSVRLSFTSGEVTKTFGIAYRYTFLR